MTTLDRTVLSPLHREYLASHAITDEVIAAEGIRSEGDMIVFTWHDGTVRTEQRRPWPGGAGTYFWEQGKPLHFNQIRDPGPEAPVLLAEGTKQSLAVASWAPPEYAVYGMPGCWGWGRCDPAGEFRGRRVLILLDADAAENLTVYEAGEKLASQLLIEDAQPLFVPSPSWGTDGIDDYLSRIPAERRAERLARLIATAQPKPSAKKPLRRKAPAAELPDTAGRPLVVVNRDRREVILSLLDALKQRWDGHRIFNFGGALTKLWEARTEPLEKDPFLRLLAETAACYSYTPESLTRPARYEPTWPDPQTIGAVLSSADEFAPLQRLVRMPFARPDGTICTQAGYDPATRSFLIMDGVMGRLAVPETPSPDDVRSAVKLLAWEWLGDMPFPEQADRANALAMIITPFIRGLVPLVPLAVVSGLQMGVGKNLLADCMAILVTGQPAAPLPYVDDEDETRKQITSAFRSGTDLFVFDEAHVIQGAQLSRAITSLTYTDRVLGVSKMVSFPNQVTWVSLGNQVQVNADMARRVYFTRLHPDCPDPQDRDARSFRHPDLRAWTVAHRPELAGAVLTLIRAWHAAGCPVYSRGTSMGSFEAWDRIMSGILAHAGVGGFLANLAQHRSESDFAGGYWKEHAAWLHETFGRASFTTSQVCQAALASGGSWDEPPGLEDPSDKNFTRKLGQAYAKNQARWFGGIRIVKMGMGHKKILKWAVEERDGGNETSVEVSNPPGGRGSAHEGGGVQGTEVSRKAPLTWEGGDGGNGGNPSPLYEREHTLFEGQMGIKPDTIRTSSTHTEGGRVSTPPLTSVTSIGIDLETADAGELFTYQLPKDLDGGFIRLAGAIGPSGNPVIMTGRDLVAILGHAGEIYGHNILGFDGLALAYHAGMDWESFAARARDTELLARQADPPRSRESGSSLDRYDLGHVAERLGAGGKTDDLRRLKKLHGGYDRIPLDDPEYRSYLEGDLRATAAVAGCLRLDDYTRREHAVASLAGRMTLNGFRVDAGLLERRAAEGAQRKADALSLLNGAWGLPLSKTVLRGRGAARHEETEPLISPLAAGVGQDWLGKIWEHFGIPDPPRTPHGDLATGSDQLREVADLPWCPEELRTVIFLMNIVTTTRTVYQTAAGALAPDGRVHPVVSMRQASGRWSVTNPGLTVFGKRGGRHAERDIFLPDEGHVLLSCDLSQVDMRAVAGHCQDPAYMALFAPGRDVHEEIAEQVFGTRTRRHDAKAVGHGWNYGLGEKRMIADGMDPVMVRSFITGMQSRFPRLMAWREEIRAAGAAGYLLDNGFGRAMRCDPQRAYTVAPALMGQGGARDIMCESLLALPQWVRPFLRVMVHDEIVLSVPAESAREIGEEVRRAMTWEWRGVPILCDMSKPGRTWGEVSAK